MRFLEPSGTSAKGSISYKLLPERIDTIIFKFYSNLV